MVHVKVPGLAFCCFVFTALQTAHPVPLNSAGGEFVVQIKRRILSLAKTHHLPKQKLWEQALWPPGVSWGLGLIHRWEGLTFDHRMTRSWSHRPCTMHLPHLAWSSNPLQILQCQKGGRTSARSGQKQLEILYSAIQLLSLYNNYFSDRNNVLQENKKYSSTFLPFSHNIQVQKLHYLNFDLKYLWHI